MKITGMADSLNFLQAAWFGAIFSGASYLILKRLKSFSCGNLPLQTAGFAVYIRAHSI
jgi:hypothetical protein